MSENATPCGPISNATELKWRSWKRKQMLKQKCKQQLNAKAEACKPQLKTEVEALKLKLITGAEIRKKEMKLELARRTLEIIKEMQQEQGRMEDAIKAQIDNKMQVT